MATILVMNCNTSAEMTAQILDAAARAARPGTKIIADQPTWGPVSVSGFYESFLSSAAVLERLAEWTDEPFDALVMAGFGEHGREGARQLLDVPVVDITEAASLMACLLGYRFGVITTTEAAVAQIEQSLLLAGYDRRCAGIEALGIDPLDLVTDPDQATESLMATAANLIERGADVLVLGCAGMSEARGRLSEQLDVPVVDGVTAAVALCEDLIELGLRTSKHSTFAPLGAARVRQSRRTGSNRTAPS